MVKILYIYATDYFEMKANHIQSIDMICALRRIGEVTFTLNINKKYKIEELKQINDDIGDTPYISCHFLQSKSSKIFYYFGLFFYHIQLLKHLNNYDIIYTPDFSFLYFLNFIPKWFFSKKVYFESHKIYHKCSSFVDKKQEIKALRNAFHIFSTTRLGSREIKNMIPNISISTLENGVSNTKFFQKNKYNNIASHFVYIGSETNWKNINILIDASRLIPSNLNIKINIYGITKRQSSQILNFHGSVGHKEINNILHNNDIGLYFNNPTFQESLYFTSPMKIMEYLYVGIPVLSISTPATQLLIKNKKNGILFKKSPQDLANAIIEIHKNPQLYKNIYSNMRNYYSPININTRVQKIKTYLK